jgi:sarcosine oxidase subunit beta
MPARLLKFAFSRQHPEPRMFTRHEKLKSSYDVVIIGAGGHGLASAYYLTRDYGIRDVAVLDGAYRCGDAHHALARGGQQALRRR